MMPVFRPHSSANVERMEFAKKLVNLMRDHNLNQADLARKSGLTRDAISTYVRARSMPEPQNLAKLAKTLGVEPSYFQLDYYRVAEKMMSPEPFNTRTDMVPQDFNKNRFDMKIQPDGSAKVEIFGVLPMAKAQELAEAWAKVVSAAQQKTTETNEPMLPL